MSATSCKHCGAEMGEAFFEHENSLCGIPCVVEANGYCEEQDSHEVLQEYVDHILGKAEAVREDGDDDHELLRRGLAYLLRWLTVRGEDPELDEALKAFLAPPADTQAGG